MANDEVVTGVFDSVIDQLRQQSRTAQYLTNPRMWAKDVLGIDLWSKQEDIFDLMMNNDHAAVRSCHGSGKSFTASIIAAWWISVHPIGEAIVVTTAPTYAQVHAILWEDIRKHHIKSQNRYKEGLSPLRLPGYITQSDQWKSDNGELLGFGRKPADNNDHGFQGIHRRYVLVIIDESCGIKENLFTAVEAITTTENSRILAIGNPDDPAAHFYNFFNRDAVWAHLDVSSFDSPNFTREHAGHYTECNHDDPDMREWCQEREWAKRWDRDKNFPKEHLAVLPNHEWVEQRRLSWGTASPLWSSKVLGEFPAQSVNTLFSMTTLLRGQNTDVRVARNSRVVLGVDLSRFGPDYTTVYKYEEGNVMGEDGLPTEKTGGRLRLIDFWGGKADADGVDGMESASRIHQLALIHSAEEIRMDVEGIGGPIADQVVRMADTTYKVVGMRGSGISPDNHRWVNARAWWYAEAERRMRMGELDIKDAKEKGDGQELADPKLTEELSQIQYHFKNRYSSLQIEKKEEMEKRGMKSPDFADAAVYAMADMSYVTDSFMGQFGIGDRFSMDPRTFFGGADNFFDIGPY